MYMFKHNSTKAQKSKTKKTFKWWEQTQLRYKQGADSGQPMPENAVVMDHAHALSFSTSQELP